ncbi:MAG: cadmium-translocating P-type ATPase [Treponema sp.]|nr:cadmium-translocating P-type ATPase [Treponema sp.]
MTKKQKKMLKRIVVASAALVILSIASRMTLAGGVQGKDILSGIPQLLLYLGVYIIIGGDILKKAFKGILNRQLFDENFLMAVATLGAFALAIYSKSGDYVEAIAVMLFYQIGELFQGIAVGKSRKNISALMDIRPDYANTEKDGKLEQVSPDEVPVGSIIVVQPGEKIPIDGIIIEGTSTLDVKSLTGESMPQSVSSGTEVISGSINISGLLKIRTTKLFGESTVSKILELVENATSRKSKSEHFISKFAKVYTPIVCYSALILAIVPPLCRILFMNASPLWGNWIYRSLTFLVISCPCALVISIPLSFFAGIGGASHEGILVKGSNYLETLSKVKTVVFDKTGTLTEGVFEVVSIHHSPLEDRKLLEYVALAECASNHPISRSIKDAYNGTIDLSRVTDIQELGGKGITAVVDGTGIAAGNEKLMQMLGIPYCTCHSVGTIVHVAINRDYAGHIVISDRVKGNAKEAIKALKKTGIDKTVMLTGDIKAVADSVAQQLDIDVAVSELLPEDKVHEVEKLLQPNRTLAFVGDGVNDAPVLSRADIGIAMGAKGSDAAIEAADIVLMDDNPAKIAKAISISKKCIGIVYQNIVFAIGIKVSCLILGALGIANMWLAIFADVGVMILAILNAIRALRVRT